MSKATQLQRDERDAWEAEQVLIGFRGRYPVHCSWCGTLNAVVIDALTFPCGELWAPLWKRQAVCCSECDLIAARVRCPYCP